MSSPAPGSLGRRDLLRWGAAAGIAALAPPLLSACDPVRSLSPLAPGPGLGAKGFVGGAEAVVGQGGWCWFQAPRASFGPDGLLWLGSSVAKTGTDLDGTVQATAFDTRSMAVVARRNLAKTQTDDHTSPSVLALGDRVQISWALHKNVDFLEVGETSRNGVLVTRRIRRPGALVAPGRGMAYASVHVVDGQRWLLYRGEQFSWNLLTSPDGVTWTARGLVVAPGAAGDRPYLHATTDGRVLHVLVTDGNPTEFRGTSAYAGTISPDLTVRNAAGTAVGTVGSAAPPPRRLTRLVTGIPGAVEQGESGDTDLWLADLQHVGGGATAVLSRRDPWPEGEARVGGYRHQYLWARLRRTGWVVEPLCWAGGELYAAQPDYSGLAAVDPSDASRVVVSTNVHPVTGELLVSAADGKVHWELFEGTRAAAGGWSFVALTQDSTEDNIRPVIAAGGDAKALAWMRGKYWSWTTFDTRIVVRRAA